MATLTCLAAVLLLCTCTEKLSVPDEFALATTVFSGKVLHIEGDGPRMSRGTPMISMDDTITVVMKVSTWWKGEKADTVHVRTARSTESCGVHFVKDKYYLVYATGTAELWTNACRRTALVDKAVADLFYLYSRE